MSLKEIYDQAYAEFTPEASDPVDNIPFYRCWFGLKAVLLHLGFADPFTAPLDVHGVCCWAKSDGGSWESVIKVLPMHTPKPLVREKSYSCFHQYEPKEPTEKEAYAIFSDQFRSAFPGKRINSKDGKAKWEKLKDKAMDLARQEYASMKARYDAEKKKYEDRLQKDDDEWAEKVRQREQQLELIRKLTEG